MKINNVVLSTVTDGFDLIKFAFLDTNLKVPYVVKGIAGLDAIDIVANFDGFGEGSTAYFDLVLPKRTVILSLGLNPVFRNARTYSDLRDELYRLVGSDRTGKVLIHFCLDDDKLATVKGAVAKIETAQFDQTQEAKITLVCDDGILRSTTVNEVDVSSFGRTFFVRDYISTAPHGFYMEVRMKEASNSFTLKETYSVFSIHKVSLEPNVLGFKENDVLKISTDRNDRWVKLLSAGKEISITEYVEGFRGARWPVLYPGRNRFELISNAELVKLEFKEAFWGI